MRAIIFILLVGAAVVVGIICGAGVFTFAKAISAINDLIGRNY